MNIIVDKISDSTLKAATDIWNEVVLEGNAFPQLDVMTLDEAREFFEGQSYTGVAVDSDSGVVVGMYILHPNNIGRCGHICNASYAVRSDIRGQHLGEYLVRDCLSKAKELGYRILEFNAVVASNERALRLYERLGFSRLGVIEGGFKNKDGVYEDIIPHWKRLV